MEAQQLLNVNFVSAQEQLRTNVNAFWGPKQASFTYTTSKWGRESSVEMLSDSDNSYQTPGFVAMGTTPRDPFIRRGWGDITAQEEAELPIFDSEPAMHASLWRTHANPQASWSTGKRETCEGELDQLVQEECGEWIFRLVEEGEESNPAGVCLGPSSPKFIQSSSGGSAES